MNDNYLVFFETSGNQAYIYGSNKLRENIGASELTYRTGTQWVLEAAGFNAAPTGQPAKFREWLKKKQVMGDVEVVLATSGKSLLVVSGEDRAKKIVAAVTTKALSEAPGLSITGAIVELPDRDDNNSVAAAMKAAHERFNTNRDLMATPSQRFAMLPFCEPCATTGLPATKKQDEVFLSSIALKKRDNKDAWFKRIHEIFVARESNLSISSSADALEKDFEGFSWLGVVFADGNGLGQVMMNFDKWLSAGDDYLDTLRAFSVELDTATEDAFYAACCELAEMGSAKVTGGGQKKRLPLVPLLLGGDDLTVLVDGYLALPFTKAFLDAFEKETEKQMTINRIAQNALAVGRLSASAGVAIVKAHFPFHSAHALAESLLKSAKLAKKHVKHSDKDNAFPCSALDFHILFDAAFSSLDDIRKERRTAKTNSDEEYRLWGGPYVVTPSTRLAGAPDVGKQWASSHALDDLLARVDLLNASDENNRLKLPNSQMHALREALPQGKQVADARLAEMRWLDKYGLDKLTENESKDSLFRKDNDHHATRFLDALTSSEFWGKSPKSKAIPATDGAGVTDGENNL